ncbi:hypothetical protein [Streptomyces sp. NPDC086023]|uniref:hypothetical protein n=1 Tax=Streptomyces sp. NPDC086023 TaxID=3365746 RepID=UPI0037D470ED
MPAQQAADGPPAPHAGAPDPADPADGPPDPEASDVTRLLCQSVYARPNRIGDLKRAWRRARGREARERRPRRSHRRRILLEGSDDCPPLGEAAAQWVVDHVLHGPARAVPSYGFDLPAVVAHSVRARRLRRLRRAAVLAALLFLAWLRPEAAVLWGGAVLLSLGLAWTTRGVGFFPLAVLVVPWILAANDTAGARPGTVGWMLWLPLAYLGAMTAVCLVDRLVVLRSLAALQHGRGTPVPRPWAGVLAARKIARLADADDAWLPYDEATQRFIGAGRETWHAAHFAIPLRPKEKGAQITPFTEEELLGHLGQALRQLGRGEAEITDPLPGFAVDRVVALQAPLWLLHIRKPERGVPDPRGQGRRSPTSHPERIYLRAQTVSWSGQVVVTTFVHCALEAGDLRLTLRPHVMTPLYNEFLVLANPLRLRGPRLAGWLAAQAVPDAVARTAAVWRRAAGKGPRSRRREEKDPVSLRDRYSFEEILDMHQSDDATRHVVLMETCAFRTVAEFLKERGVDTALYEKQVATVINTIQVFGDNTAPIQAVAAGQSAAGVSQQ